ncbi:MAG: F0F1 ATP synthase subunit A [Candidatus Dactylopiibacterium carminicum]|uniref:ATP synthase subunit a n=1 Tax=Candidatus Dactylopiibacterium carminicum TaxID=857335 RepID=A0A272EMZ2_9RHOO|nr:F0F1 ATP synthase subunit A [Candidatus Dactylopiibacterium carminicum]KAF7597902.1 F0F1 ATP synthase subunit A [Candidatus Dactylopiibacterium carminicum]PAS91471.1 MAG: F0F1 ATP synthase subunit A [Candidatus Dactylopiibacterium carminicum]PAS95893.1 MAG: F0F1 ATP synthase subunit A [Candidatus Dactylopiibacterium carminicum]
MAAEQDVTQHSVSAGEYIAHHLTFLNGTGGAQKDLIDFGLINYDTVFWAVFIALSGGFLLWFAARRATAGVPGRFQAAVEILVEMVADQAKDLIHSTESRKFVAPLALTVFIWVFLMNAMDFLPVNLIPNAWTAIYAGLGHDPHHAYMRVVPTADINATMGMAVTVLLLCLYYNIKIKGVGGWAHELVSAPFGSSKNPLFALILGVINLAMQLIEFCAKTVSHGMRLFGNMFAGELIFMLIALMGATWTGLNAPSVFLMLGHIVAGFAWAVFHILVVTLQAFIFMMLTLVYIGQAHEGH